MASELYTFDHSFFSDPFSPFSDHNEIFPTFDDSNLNILTNNDCNLNNITNNAGITTPATAAINEVVASPADETITLDQIAKVLLAASPTSDSLFAGNSQLPVKGEEFLVPFGGGDSFAVAAPPENAGRMMQRSYSSNCFDGKPAGMFYRPDFEEFLDQATNFQSQQAVNLNPFQTDFSSATQIRRVCSTGDLHVKTGQNRAILPSSPEGTEEPYFRVGKYTPAERKEKIYKYRVKRNQRNFNKTIKYACRKTLADNRPRIRGRFARNDEVAETPRASSSTTSTSSSTMFHSYGQYQDQVWVGDDEGSSAAARPFGGGKAFYSTFGSAPNYSYYNSY